MKIRSRLANQIFARASVMFKAVIAVVLMGALGIVVLERDSDIVAQLKTALPFFDTGVTIDFDSPLTGLFESKIVEQYKALSFVEKGVFERPTECIAV